MQSQSNQNQHIELDKFIVKVKLLTNQVYEFQIDPNATKVQDLKKMIQQKLNIPIQRQRIVFGGKALVDANNVTQYVKQSGMTVHLIAKMASTQPTNTNPNTESNTNSQTNANQSSQNIPNFNSPPSNSNNPQQNPNPNPFSNIFQMVLGGPQQATMSFNNMNDLTNSLGGILGGFGLPIRPNTTSVNSNQHRTPTNPTSQQNQNTRTQPVNSFQTPVNESRRQANQTNNQQNNQTSNNQSQSNQPATYNVSNQPLLQINAAISQLNLPPQPVRSNAHMNLREQTSQYLRRLQHQMMRMIPQLNRGIQLLNEGRVTHMAPFIPLFQGLNVANLQAIRAIRSLNNLATSTQNVTGQQNNPNNINQAMEEPAQISMQATIIIGNQDNGQNNQINQQEAEENDFSDIPEGNGQIRIQSNTFQVPQGFNLSNINGLLSGLMGGQGMNVNRQNTSNHSNPTTNNSNTNSSVRPNQNVGNTSNPNPQNQNVGNSSNPNPQSQGQNQPFNLGSLFGGLLSGQNMRAQNNQQGSSNPSANFGNLASMMFSQNPVSNTNQNSNNANNSASNQSQNTNSNMSQQQPTTNSTGQQQPTINSNPPPSNPFGGINIMEIFSQLNQTGGVGQIMSMSLGDMLDQASQEPSVYGQIFQGVTGQDLMSCLTSKNVDFLDRKHEQFRQNLLKAIAIAGSRQDLIKKISTDIQTLLVPRQQTRNIQECSQKVRKITRRRIEQLVSVTLNRQNQKYSERFMAIMKSLLCQSIDQTLPYVNQHSQEIVFNNIKKNVVAKLDEFIPGLSGMLYSFIQRDLIRVYKEHRAEIQRKQKQSQEEKLTEENLIQQIQNESKKDIQYMKNIKHSEYYYPK